MKYYLGLDNGGTATKASVYDDWDGNWPRQVQILPC